MRRAAVASIVLLLVGVLLVVTAPPDPQYSVSVDGPTDAPSDESVVAFGNLSQENRELFRENRDDEKRYADAPGVEEVYVRYEGDTYRMSSAAHESPVLSLLMPPLGGLFVLAGCVVAAYSYLSGE